MTKSCPQRQSERNQMKGHHKSSIQARKHAGREPWKDHYRSALYSSAARLTYTTPTSVPGWIQKREHESEKVERVLKEGVIELTMSERARPVVCALQKDEEVRLGVSYSKLNAFTAQGAHALPRMMYKCTDLLVNAIIFSTVDCNNGYWQTTIPEADRDETILSSHHRLFPFILVPFGLEIAPAFLLWAVSTILSRVKCHSLCSIWTASSSIRCPSRNISYMCAPC